MVEATKSEKSSEKYWIDTDCGVDDGECIIVALHYLNVIGISTVAGNCDVDQSAINVSKILEMCGKEVPIYHGCKTPLIDPLIRPGVHGDDGFGETDIGKTIKGRADCIKKENGVTELIRMANEMNGELNLIMIGPATNLAVAFKLDEDLPKKIKSITMMGGTYTVCRGNTTLTTEYNWR